MEKANRVRSTANARHDRIRQSTLALKNLGTRFLANDALEITNKLRIRVRPRGGTDAVERVMHIRHPVAQGFIHRILERAGAG